MVFHPPNVGASPHGDKIDSRTMTAADDLLPQEKVRCLILADIGHQGFNHDREESRISSVLVLGKHMFAVQEI